MPSQATQSLLILAFIFYNVNTFHTKAMKINKILPDENIDVNFKEEFREYEIKTVKDNGRTGIESGKLLF